MVTVEEIRKLYPEPEDPEEAARQRAAQMAEVGERARTAFQRLAGESVMESSLGPHLRETRERQEALMRELVANEAALARLRQEVVVNVNVNVWVLPADLLPEPPADPPQEEAGA
jgi:uncharacterized Rossmann fold enzyme